MTTAVTHNYAFTAVVAKGGSMIGRADRGTAGYTPLPEHGKFPKHSDAQAKARELNKAEGITEREALEIVCGTIGAQNKDKRAEAIAAAHKLLAVLAFIETNDAADLVLSEALRLAYHAEGPKAGEVRSIVETIAEYYCVSLEG